MENTCTVAKGLKSDSTVLFVPRIPVKENLIRVDGNYLNRNDHQIFRKPEYIKRKSPLRQTFFVSL